MEEIKVKLDGTYMNVIKFGSGSNNLVIISGISLCGLEGQGEAIANAYRLFHKDYTCYLFDRKNVIEDGYTVKDMAQDVYKSLNILGVNRADYFGVSQGAMMAMVIAAEYPHAVRKMVLGSGAVNLSRKSKELLEQMIYFSSRADVVSLNRMFFKNVYSDEFFEQNRDAFKYLENIGTEEDCRRFVILLMACLNFAQYDGFEKIKCPALVIGAKNDRIFPGEQASREIADMLGCELYLYENYGHAVYDEAPDYKERIISFLKA